MASFRADLFASGDVQNDGAGLDQRFPAVDEVLFAFRLILILQLIIGITQRMIRLINHRSRAS